MRARMARALVRWVSWWIDMAYRMNIVRLPRAEKVFGRGGQMTQKIAFPLARRLDKEAMGDQMVNEGWWG